MQISDLTVPYNPDNDLDWNNDGVVVLTKTVAFAAAPAKVALIDSTVGTVLGVRFFTDTLTWRLSPKKFTTTTEALSVPLLAGAM